jgi:hypothetical protein
VRHLPHPSHRFLGRGSPGLTSSRRETIVAQALSG